MKKLAFVLSAALLLGACASNRNILNEKMSKYPAEQYLTKVAFAQTKAEAKAAAAAELAKLFDGLPESEGSEVRRDNILSLIKTVQWWKNKENKRYYAIAVLERNPALKTIEPYYLPIDGQLNALTAKIAAESDKFVKIKSAISMPALLAKREALDSEYRRISFDASAYNEETLYFYKSIYNKTFYDIKINAVLTGVDDITVKTYIIDALNDLGFGVGEKLSNYDIELSMNTQIDKYASSTLDGLYWSTATATVALKDAATQGIFATFSETERVGSARGEEAKRRSLVAAGKKCAPTVKTKLLDYIQKK